MRVWWSYITSAFIISLPDTPKVCSSSPMVRLYTIAEKQSGHHVTATGLPPTVSLTISCALRVGIEYARWSPFIERPSTRLWSSSSSLATSALTNSGSSIAGIASKGSSVTISRSRSSSSDVTVAGADASDVAALWGTELVGAAVGAGADVDVGIAVVGTDVDVETAAAVGLGAVVGAGAAVGGGDVG